MNIVGDTIARAIVAANVKYVVNLSSLGAEHADNVGPIRGLYDQEQRLNRIESINVVHLRAAYFYENILFAAQLIKNNSLFATSVAPSTTFAHASTDDIATVAAQFLKTLDFSGK